MVRYGTTLTNNKRSSRIGVGGSVVTLPIITEAATVQRRTQAQRFYGNRSSVDVRRFTGEGVERPF